MLAGVALEYIGKRLGISVYTMLRYRMRNNIYIVEMHLPIYCSFTSIACTIIPVTKRLGLLRETTIGRSRNIPRLILKA